MAATISIEVQREEDLPTDAAHHGGGPTRPRATRPATQPPAGQGSQLAPRAVSQRLSLYLRQLQALRDEGCATVSSRQLARSLDVSAAQVRKDLAFFGQFGLPGVGYQVDPLIARIRRILGTHRLRRAAIVGVGHLGRALIGYPGFDEQGFRIAALFDADPALHGRTFGGVAVRPVEDIEATVARERIEIAILAVPAEVAQDVADRVVRAGVGGILNFAPTRIVVPPTVGLAAVDLSIQLEQITHQLAALEADDDDDPGDPRSDAAP